MLTPRFINTLLILVGVLVLASCNPDSGVEEIPTLQDDKATIDVVPTAPTPQPTVTKAATDTPIPPTDTPVPTPKDTPVPEEVTVFEDILYARAVDPQAQDQYLDIYVPGSPGDYPVVLWAHPIFEDKNTGRTLGRILANNGIVAVSVSVRNDYDLTKQYQDTDQEIRILREVLEDAECALQFIGSQMEKYGGDPERLIWTGFSYGAWLGSLISFSEGGLQNLWDEYEVVKNGPQQQVVCTVQVEPAEVTAFVGSGTLLFKEFWFGAEGEADPTADVPELRDYAAIGHNPDVKVRLIYGKFDFFDSEVIEGSELFATALEDSGYDVAIFRQDGHHEPYFQQVIEQVLDLVQE